MTTKTVTLADNKVRDFQNNLPYPYITGPATVHTENGRIHRDNDAAIILDPKGKIRCGRGRESWSLTGPAEIYFYRGTIGRKNYIGPSIVAKSGSSFCFHGSENEVRIGAGGLEIWMRSAGLHRDDGPALFRQRPKYEAWFAFNRLHRDDGPALKNGEMEMWCWNGVPHREDGPAIIHSDETYEWYFFGVKKRSMKTFLKLKHLDDTDKVQIKLMYG